MRHNAKRSSRGNKGNNQNRRPNKMKVYDSNGPDVRIRGTAYQITEKYETLAKDAETSGNFILAENYRQHAEHYQRIINSFEENAPMKTVSDKKPDQKNAQNGNESMSSKDDNDGDLGLPASMIQEAKLQDETVSA